MDGLRFAIWLTALAGSLPAATLERLSFEEMTAKSTAIVRGRVTGSYAAAHGRIIYTHYRVRVSERWKGPVAVELDVVVPGGSAAGLRQSFAGAPKLAEGAEYVLFLWTGASRLTHVIGLSQGVFDLQRDATGALVAMRAASSEVLLDPASGRAVNDQPLRLRLEDLSQRIKSTLARSAAR